MQTLDADEWRPRSRRKDTKHWCRGKVGVAHVYVTIESKWPYQGQQCEWRDHRWSSVFAPYWFCHHSIVCANCGKISVHVITDPALCPDYDGSAPPG